MKTEIYFIGIMSVFFMFSTMLFVPKEAQAHCDTLEGPVVQTARAALATGDITPVLKWVRTQDEEQIRLAFDKALSVRKKGDDVQELADLYFFETLVRIHRAGEGAPYTGLKSSDTIDPAVGVYLHKRPGEKVSKGEILCDIHTNRKLTDSECRKRALSAFVISSRKPS